MKEICGTIFGSLAVIFVFLLIMDIIVPDKKVNQKPDWENFTRTSEQVKAEQKYNELKEMGLTDAQIYELGR